MNIDAIVRLIGDTEPREVEIAGLSVKFEWRYDAPIKWDINHIMDSLHVDIPEDLQNLWQCASKLYIAEDMTYGQWGLLVWSPQETIYHNRSSSFYAEEELLNGDILIGEFRGDSDKVIIRCDNTKDDFGSIVIAVPIDGREKWDVVASSLSEFLLRFLESPLDKKYWE